MSQQQQQPQRPATITDIVKPELPNLMAILSLSNENANNSIETMALQELNYLEQQALAKPEIATCHKTSIVLAVKNVMRKNLTLDPSAGLVYVKTRKMQINNVWQEVLEIQETVNGLLSYNRQLGRILDFERPQVQKNDKGRVIGVTMRLLLPSPLGPRWELFDYDESDFKRWATYSHKERSRSYKPNNGKEEPNITTLNYANQLYRSWEGGIDPEFARAKCIRHSVKKLGTNPNENAILIKLAPTEQLAIDANVAVAETADDNGEFAWHEEVTSTVKQMPTINGTAPQQTHVEDDFANNL